MHYYSGVNRGFATFGVLFMINALVHAFMAFVKCLFIVPTVLAVVTFADLRVTHIWTNVLHEPLPAADALSMLVLAALVLIGLITITVFQMRFQQRTTTKNRHALHGTIIHPRSITSGWINDPRR